MIGVALSKLSFLSVLLFTALTGFVCWTCAGLSSFVGEKGRAMHGRRELCVLIPKLHSEKMCSEMQRVTGGHSTDECRDDE